MEQLFNFKLEKISNFSNKEMLERKKNLDFFLEKGFPNKKDENWKFTDLNSIISKNFKKITNNLDFEFEKKIDYIQEFEHNSIVTVNGSLKSSDMQFEEKGKIKIDNLVSLEEFNLHSNNNLYHLK